MQTIGITGGTGFIGKHLARLLTGNGYRTVIFTRDMHKVKGSDSIGYSYWNPSEKKADLTYIKELDGIVHLAGAGIADKRWTKKRKELIVRSRVESTQFLIKCLQEHAPRCKTLVAASAIGYYGQDKDRKEDRPFRENAPPGSDFLADTCRQWEAASLPGGDFLRRTILRFGIVLGKESGAFPRFADPQNWGIVPILGNGRQIISWIHAEDLCRLILWSLKHTDMQGAYNAATPCPVSHRRLMMTIAQVKGGLKIPVPVPAVLLKAGLGELATEVLKSCTVSAEKTLGSGFTFRYRDIETAVKNILEKN